MHHSMQKTQRVNRRMEPRVNISGAVSAWLLNDAGTPVGKVFTGTLLNISTRGMAFMTKTSLSEKARLLLGRKMNMQFLLTGQDSKHPLNLDGTVVSVIYHLFKEYSIHVKFDGKLNPEWLPKTPKKQKNDETQPSESDSAGT